MATEADRPALLDADVARIPDVLRAGGGSAAARTALAVVAAIAGVPRRPRRLVLTGLGSSRYAALVVAPALRDAGLDVVVEHATTARPAAIHPGDLVVGISSSGRTPETVAAVRAARSSGVATLAITNDPGAALAAAADATLPLGAGTEASGVASTTYAATLAVLAELAQALAAPVDADATRAGAADAVASLLASRGAWLAPAADALAGGRPVHVLADGTDAGTAEQVALMVREGPRLDAVAFDTGDWLHVGVYTALPGARALLLSGSAADGEVATTIDGRGGRVVVLGREVERTAATIPLAAPPSDPIARGIEAVAAATLLAAELWRR